MEPKKTFALILGLMAAALAAAQEADAEGLGIALESPQYKEVVACEGATLEWRPVEGMNVATYQITVLLTEEHISLDSFRKYYKNVSGGEDSAILSPGDCKVLMKDAERNNGFFKGAWEVFAFDESGNQTARSGLRPVTLTLGAQETGAGLDAPTEGPSTAAEVRQDAAAQIAAPEKKDESGAPQDALWIALAAIAALAVVATAVWKKRVWNKREVLRSRH